MSTADVGYVFKSIRTYVATVTGAVEGIAATMLGRSDRLQHREKYTNIHGIYACLVCGKNNFGRNKVARLPSRGGWPTEKVRPLPIGPVRQLKNKLHCISRHFDVSFIGLRGDHTKKLPGTTQRTPTGEHYHTSVRRHFCRPPRNEKHTLYEHGHIYEETFPISQCLV